MSKRNEFLYVVLTRGPGPASDFIEVENDHGEGVWLADAWVYNYNNCGCVALRIEDPKSLLERIDDLTSDKALLVHRNGRLVNLLAECLAGLERAKDPEVATLRSKVRRELARKWALRS